MTQQSDLFPELLPCPIYERVFSACLPEVGRAFKFAYEQEAVPPAELASRVQLYLSAIESSAKAEEFMDVSTARRVAQKCLALTELISQGLDKRLQKLAQAAVVYFVLDDDGEPDTDSIVGFDDDLEIVEAVTKELEGELKIQLQSEAN